jgi:hypothetical protein
MAASLVRFPPQDHAGNVRAGRDTERMNTPRTLADRLAELLSRERSAMAGFLVALSDFDRKRAWAGLGYSSLFWFLHRELGLSKGAAYNRKIAAELIERHPEVLAPLRDGRLCLTSIVELAKVTTRDNVVEVLPRFFHLSRREAAEVSAAIRPVARPPLRDVVSQTIVTPVAAVRDTPVVVHPKEWFIRMNHSFG